jgi:hypothetical protein
MKRKSVLTVVFTLIIFTAGWAASSGVGTAGDVQSAKLPVLKVFAAKDGEAMYRAYLVKYKDQEVIVPDTLVRTQHKVGDTISVTVIRNKFPGGKPGPDLMSFALGF